MNLALLHRFPAATLAAMAAVSVGAVAVALVSQHVFDMQPCPWCVLQRLVFVLIALAAGTGALWRRPAGRRRVPDGWRRSCGHCGGPPVRRNGARRGR